MAKKYNKKETSFEKKSTKKTTMGLGKDFEKKEIPEKKEKVFVAKDPIPEKHPKVALNVFCRVAGRKWDQLSGFRQWAKNLGSLTVTEWRKKLEEFDNKPTGKVR